MAADASIRVSTKVDTSEMSKLQKEFDNAEKRLQKLYDKGEKLEALGVDKKSRQWKSLVYDTAKQENVVEDLKEKLNSAIDIKTDKPANEFKKVQDSAKKCFDSIDKRSKKTSGLMGNFGKRLKALIAGFFIFQTITKIFRKMVDGMKEGFQNLAQYSKEYNTAMSDMKSQTAQMKNGLAAAFEPIVSAVIPYITQLISWMNVGIDKVGQFLAAISGRNSYTKAKKQTIDYARALKQAGNAAKGALASFDQINTLNGGGIGDGGELIGANAFEAASIEAEATYLAEKVLAIFAPVKESLQNMFTAIDFTPIINSFEGLGDSLMPIIDGLGVAMSWLIDNVLSPITNWIIGDALPVFFNVLASAVDLCVKAFELMQPALDYIWNNALVPIGQFIADVFINLFNDLNEVIQYVTKTLDEHGESVKVVFDAIAKAVCIVVQSAIKQVKTVVDIILGMLNPFLEACVNVIAHIIDILSGLINFITGVFSGDWKKAWEGIMDIFKGIINIIIDIYEGAVNMIIGALNKISIKVPDWIPGVGGQEWGFNLQKMSLPRLAEGAVIPGGRPFAAILGDQRAGQTNIETPLSTMVDAFKQAMSDIGVGGEYTFVAEIDGKEIFRETVSQDKMYRKKTGKSAFSY